MHDVAVQVTQVLHLHNHLPALAAGKPLLVSAAGKWKRNYTLAADDPKQPFRGGDAGETTGDNGRQRETTGDDGRQRETTGDNRGQLPLTDFGRP